jgi:hypothetical protein
VTWLARIALASPSIAGDGTSWEDHGDYSAAEHLRAAQQGAAEPLDDAALLRYAASWLRDRRQHTAHRAIVLAGWLAVEQERKQR